MNKKILILIIIAITALFVIGCENGDNEESTGPSPYIGGTKGLIAEFEPMGIEENGIYSIYENEEFPIQVVLKNKGEHEIKTGDVTVKIYGILLEDFSGIDSGTKSNEKEIEKISEFNEEGGEEIINFGQNVKYTQEIPGTFYDLNIFASYTYNYKTYASVPNVCFKENLRDERVCTVEESKDIFCSGAPIRVIKAEEKPAGSGIIELDFEIENMGGGRSTLPGQEFSPQYDQLAFKIEPETERNKWLCRAGPREDQARLIDGKATIRCKLREPLEEDTLYTKAIGLTLSYDYRDIIQQKLRIEKET